MSESNNHYNSSTPVYDTRGDADADDEIDLAQLWAILRGGKWRIAGCVIAALILAVAYLLVVKPTYQANAMLQVETDQSTSPLQGIDSQLRELAGKNSGLAEAEMQIMKSRSVLGDTVHDLHLNLVAKPAYLPVIGQAIARRRQPDPKADPPAKAGQGGWLSNHAWFPTTIKVTRFDMPDALLGKAFTLRALGGGRYALYGPKGKQLLKGQAGEAASGETPDGGKIGLFVQQLQTYSPPTDFTVVHRPWLEIAKSLGHKLSVSEQGQDSGIVSIALKGHDRTRITAVVNSVANTYLQKNVQAHSQQAKQSLSFLKKQLPELKSGVQTAETKLANYQQKSGHALDLSQAGQSLLSREVDLHKQRSEIKMKLAQMHQLYTGNTPKVRALKEQLNQTEAQQKQLKKQFDQLPDAEKTVLKLQRDVQVKTQLYTALLNRAQQLRVMKAGTIGNVRIVDHAVQPVQAVAPKKRLVLALALVLGAMVGAGWTFLRVAMRRSVEDPNEIEQQLGVPIYAVIPFSGWLAQHSRRAARRKAPFPVLAHERGEDISVEALPSLRTSLYFAQMEGGSNAILVTGPSPEAGKSFVSVNLAYLLAETEQRVVILDADMRKGRMHEFLEDRRREPGLSQVLTGQVPLQDALRSFNGSRVQMLPCGQIPPNPSELLMREAFSELLGRLKREFDLVIIDAPPVLAVTDANVIAGVDPGIVAFLVVRAGTLPMAAIEESMKRLQRNNKIAGVIFNGYKQTHADAGYYGHNYYQYAYKSET